MQTNKQKQIKTPPTRANKQTKTHVPKTKQKSGLNTRNESVDRVGKSQTKFICFSLSTRLHQIGPIFLCWGMGGHYRIFGRRGRLEEVNSF